MGFLATLFYLLTVVFRRTIALAGPVAPARKEQPLPVAVFRFPPENPALSFAFYDNVLAFLRWSNLFSRFRFALPRLADGRLIIGRCPHFLMSSPALCPARSPYHLAPFRP